MNETVKCILERRSIRSYKPDPIPEDVLRQIIDCGLYAPSASNKQARQLLVLKKREEIRRLQAVMVESAQKPGHDRYKDGVKSPGYSITKGEAPVFAIVTADPTGHSAESDAALVLGNMFNAAWALGIGSCWINQLGPVENEPVFRALLTEYGVPEHYKLYGAACFGYPAAEPAAPAPRKENTLLVRG